MENDILSIINEVDDFISYVQATYEIDDIAHLIKEYKAYSIELNIASSNFRICCDKKMSVNVYVNELICQVCGRSRVYRELVFDKNQLLGYDKYKGKQSKYNPTRNFHKWVSKITCRDDQVPQYVLQDIVQKFKRDYNDFERGKYILSIKAIRNVLKQLGYSKYNTYTAYIRQYLTLLPSPDLSESDIKRISVYYNKIIHIYYHISHNFNIPYCPHIIIKIIENIFPPEDDKQTLKYFVHFQNQHTIQKFDMIWKSICEKIPEFIYKPMDITLYA